MGNKKVLKIIAVIIALLILVFIIYFGRKFIIISKLSKAREEFLSSNNYSCSIVNITQDGVVSNIEYKYKDGRSIDSIETDSNSWKTWIERNDKERIVMQENGDQLKATITDFQDDNSFDSSTVDWKTIVSNKLKSAFLYNIKSEKIDEKEYYVFTSKLTGAGSTYYFDKDTLFMTELDFIGGGKIYYNNFETNTVTDADVIRPDLTRYDVVDNS